MITKEQLKNGDVYEATFPDKTKTYLEIKEKNNELNVYAHCSDEYFPLVDILNNDGLCPYKLIGNIYENPSLLEQKEG